MVTVVFFSIQQVMLLSGAEITEIEVWIYASVCFKTRRLNPLNRSPEIKGQNADKVKLKELASL